MVNGLRDNGLIEPSEPGSPGANSPDGQEPHPARDHHIVGLADGAETVRNRVDEHELKVAFSPASAARNRHVPHRSSKRKPEISSLIH